MPRTKYAIPGPYDYEVQYTYDGVTQDKSPFQIRYYLVLYCIVIMDSTILTEDNMCMFAPGF